MKLSLIAAYDKNKAIGYKNKLPWIIKKDTAWFKSKTIGKSVIMGRKTCESLVKALPERNNIVITTNPCYIANGFHIASSLDEAFFIAKYLDNNINPEIFIIGGSTLYRQSINKAHTLYLTEINHEYKADTWFPAFDRSKFNEISKINNNENGIDFNFVTLERK